MDKASFILGMITAFCECVAGGCKRLALSPPLTDEDYAAVAGEAYRIIEQHGLKHGHEDNADRPEKERFHWILIAGRQQTLDEYRRLREKHLSPAESLVPFYALLSYDPQESVHTGYDAYKAYFPPEAD